MIHKIFSVYDSKAGIYQQPFYAPNRPVAERMFTNALKSDGPIAQNPEDYTLFVIGSFDDATAELIYEDKEGCITALEAISLLERMD